MVRESMKRTGFILALSAPSGTGKTTVAKKLLRCMPNMQQSISWNTRAKRAEETDGVDYVFVSEQKFLQHQNADGFVETIEVYGTWRGTPKGPLEQNMHDGRDTICVIEWNGVRALKELYGKDVVSVFLYPPSLEVLRNRLLFRAQDSAEEMKRRMQKAQAELETGQYYDYGVVNDVLEECVQTLQHIIWAEGNKTCRFIRQNNL